MGHEKNILHGMFMSAYFLESIRKNEMKEISLKFIKPLYLPDTFSSFEKNGLFFITNKDKNQPLLEIRIS